MDWGYITGYFDGEGTVEFYRSRSKGAKAMRCALCWHNSDRESLEQIVAFMGCGKVRTRKRVGFYKVMYGLHVEKRTDLLRVLPFLIMHSIIKKSKLVKLQGWLQGEVRDRPEIWGSLAKLGTEEIRRLYWSEKKSQKEIGLMFGVTQTGVRNFMHRHGIPSRSLSASGLLAKSKISQEAEDIRRKKIADFRREQWTEPSYRSKMIKAIRAGQSKRLKLLPT